MKEIRYVNGPYINNKGYRYVRVFYMDGTKEGMHYSRYLIEQKLGRELTEDEIVDHIDDDYTNDSLDNLQIITQLENIKKRDKHKGWGEFKPIDPKLEARKLEIQNYNNQIDEINRMFHE